MFWPNDNCEEISSTDKRMADFMCFPLVYDKGNTPRSGLFRRSAVLSTDVPFFYLLQKLALQSLF
tara:strand:- start:35256 stop:35450 length:195 start_codon:yes stop_codon:yes gene_type:complete